MLHPWRCSISMYFSACLNKTGFIVTTIQFLCWKRLTLMDKMIKVTSTALSNILRFLIASAINRFLLLLVGKLSCWPCHTHSAKTNTEHVSVFAQKIEMKMNWATFCACTWGNHNLHEWLKRSADCDLSEEPHLVLFQFAQVCTIWQTWLSSKNGSKAAPLD